MRILVRSVVKRVFRVIFEDPRILLPYFLLYLLILGQTILRRLFPGPSYFDQNPYYNLALSLVWALSFLYILAYAYDHLEGLSVNISKILRQILSKLFPLLLLTILIYVIRYIGSLFIILPSLVLVPFSLVNSFFFFLGGLLLLYLFLILSRWLIRLLTFPYIAVLFEDLTPLEAFHRSAEIVDEDFWAVVRALLIGFVIAILIYILASLLTFALTLFLTLATASLSQISLFSGLFRFFLSFLALAGVCLVFSASTTFGTIMIMVLYKSLTFRQIHPSQRPAPRKVHHHHHPHKHKVGKSWFTPLHIVELILAVLITILLVAILLKPLISKSAPERVIPTKVPVAQLGKMTT